MKTLLLALALVAMPVAVTDAAQAREQTATRKARVPACETSNKCCAHPRVPRARSGARADVQPKPEPKPPEQTWQEKMASKGSGG